MAGLGSFLAAAGRGAHSFVSRHPWYSRAIAVSPLVAHGVAGGYGRDAEALGESMSEKAGDRIVKGLRFAEDVVPKIGDAALYGTIDPLQDWIKNNKGTAAAMAGAAVLPVGVFALLAMRDKAARSRRLEKEAGIPWKSVGTVAGAAAATPLALLPPWFYFAPPSWPGSKDKAIGAAYDTVVDKPAQGYLQGLMGESDKSLRASLPRLGTQAGQAVGKAALDPKMLAVGVGAPLAAYLLWRMSDAKTYREKRKAADALLKARAELDAHDRAALGKSAGWVDAVKHVPTYAGLTGLGAIGASVWSGGAKPRLKSGGGVLTERFGNTVEKTLDKFDPGVFEDASRRTTDAFLKELDKRKWPVLGAIAGSTALLAGAKYLMERREREAEADIDEQSEYINKRKRNQGSANAF